MVILELTLRNFGKFNQKQLEFQEGINLIYGENEAGKSTIHTFIRGMLFGIEKQRGRASKNDVYSLYEPWENPAYFEGVLRFEEGGQVYKIQRRFHKSTKEFIIINETEGRELKEDEYQKLVPWLNETTYANTISIGQLKSATNVGLVGELNNYIANLNTTSHMELDIGKASTFLKKKKKENEVKLNLEAEGKLTRFEEEIRLVEQEIEQIGLKKEELEEEQYALLHKESKLENVENPNKSNKWYLTSIVVIIIFLLFEIGLVIFAQDSSLYLKILIGFMFLLSMCNFFWNMQYRKKYVKSEDIEKKKKDEKDKDLIKQIQKLEWKIEQLQESVVKIQESIAEYRIAISENEKIQEEVEAIDLALTTIQDISLNIKHGFGDMVNHQTSKLVEKFTNGKYKDLKVDESLNVRINDSEKLIPLEQVSKGTIEQIYLALRLALADVLFGSKNMPILLDDAFVLYDGERLANSLKQLGKMDRQILIFTCHEREKEILETLQIPYSYTELV
ncbi:MAG: AAA family ATPase [Clostridiales bacterium]|nr:AAA family ATPase [Clostridiales bacterium]